MEIKKWKQEEIDFLKENFDKYTVKKLANKLNRSDYSVYHMIKKIKLSKQEYRLWTKDEENYLRENYLSMTAEDMAKHLNRGLLSVRGHLKSLNLIKEPNWTKEDIEFLINNYKDMDRASICKILNRSERAIEHKSMELNLVRVEKWSEEEDEKLKELYRKMSYKEIGKLLDRSPNAVQARGRKLGLKKSPYYCNYRFFENIDTEEKAYWLGFIAADGCVMMYEETGGTVGIALQYGDINHLKKFNKSIGGNYRITEVCSPCLLSKNKDKLNHKCNIRINSTDMCNDLINHGITCRKTYTLKFPETIPKHLIRHFMRGYFDGDGCLSFTGYTPYCDYVSASKQIIYDFEKILHNVGITSTKIYTRQKEGFARIWCIRINQGDNKNIIKFLNYLYKDATVYLDRKYEKYIKVLQKYNERLPHQSEMTGSF